MGHLSTRPGSRPEQQFYEAYADAPILAALLRVLFWSKHLLFLSRCKSPEEKQFYLVSAARSRWSHRELHRQIMSSAFERAMLLDQKLASR